MSEANQYEQEMLDLINAERAAANLNPLVFNSDLNEASEDHSEWMLETDSFTHTGVDGSSSRERIEAAGYELEGNWKTGENIAWVNEAGSNGLSDEVVRLHTNLMNSPEHRANILNPDFEEIGIGIETGDFDENGQLVDSVFVTQNFGTTSSTTVTVPAPEPDETPEQTPAPDITAGTSFDIAAFMQAQGFSAVAPQSGEADNTGPTVTTGTSTSSVQATSVASSEDGPSVTVEGEGNFTGGGSATVEETTATVFDAGNLAPEDVGSTAPSADVSPAGLEVLMGFDSFVFDFLASSDGASGTMTNGLAVQSTGNAAEDAMLEILAMRGEADLSQAAQEAASLATGNFSTLVEDFMF